MATNLNVRVNYQDATISYQNTPGNYITLDLTNDYLIWTEGSDDVTDLMTHEPTASELNEAAVIIDEDADKEVPYCYLMDYSHDVGGSYYTHEIKGIGEDKRYVFGFSFDGPTANEPTLEAWDDDNHNSTDKHVLGNGTPADSMVYGIGTTSGSPGAAWAGTAIAGSAGSRKIDLNDGAGALGSVPSGQTTQELYANIKIVIPQDYANPAVENFILTCRYTWN